MAPPAAVLLLQPRQGQHQEIVPPTHVDEGRVANLHWGLLSGLLTTTRGALEVPAGGLPPVEALALFAALWASVSTSL